MTHSFRALFRRKEQKQAGMGAQTRADFIGWVDRYLKADPTSDYRLGSSRGLIVLELRKTVTSESGSTLDIYRRYGHDGVLDAIEPFSAISQDLSGQCHANLSFE
jgi:hypothetical protein